MTTNTLFDALMGSHRGDDRAALILPDSRTISHDALHLLSGRLANLLVSEGVKPGDRVAAQVEKSPEAFALYLATLRAGAVFLPLNTAPTAGPSTPPAHRPPLASGDHSPIRVRSLTSAQTSSGGAAISRLTLTDSVTGVSS